MGDAGPAGDIVLEAVGLTKEFLGFTAVRNVDLKVKRGTVHALIGPNGAGKTTVFNLLTKFLRPTAGRILHRGEDITGLDPADVALRGLVRSFQISAIFPHLTVRENVRLALQRSLGVSYRFWMAESALSSLHPRVDELLESVGLVGYAELAAAELSYGRRRALEIATTLALEPEVLLLDEPTSGLGLEDVDRVAQLIKTVAATRTVLMVEHNLSVVSQLSDWITVLARGQILAEGPYEEVSRHPDVIQAYIGGGHA